MPRQTRIWVTRHLTSPLLAPLQIPCAHHPPLHHHFLAPLPHIIHRLLNLRDPLPDASVKLWDFQSHVLARGRSLSLAGDTRKPQRQPQPKPKRKKTKSGRGMAQGDLMCADFASSRSSPSPRSRILHAYFTSLHLEHWSYPRSNTPIYITFAFHHYDPISSRPLPTHDHVFWQSVINLVRCYFSVKVRYRSLDICTTVF
jgi:hypothetical protein